MNRWVRPVHRWLSIAFTATVIANFVAGWGNLPSEWSTSPLVPLFLVLFSGLYMFVPPIPPNGVGGDAPAR